MKLTRVHGWGQNCYMVGDLQQFDEICRWMKQQEVRYLHVSSSPFGYAFEVQSNFEWFSLKWL